MGTTDIQHVASRSTAHRIRTAWLRARPLGRAGSAIAAALTLWVAFRVHDSPSLRVGAATSGVLLALAALVDAHERRLPNQLLAAALAAALVGPVTTLELGIVFHAVLGMLMAGGLLLAVRLSRGVGMGDVKMAAVVGAGVGAVSLTAVPVAVALAALVATAFALVTRRPSLPLGPSLWLGWLGALAAVQRGWLS